MALEIAELEAAAVRSNLDDLAQLLLDAHASGMALGLPAPLSRDDAREAYADAAARLVPGERLLLAAFDDGRPVGAVQLDRAAHGEASLDIGVVGLREGECRRLPAPGPRP